MTTAGGTSATSSSDHFTYALAPTVTAVSPPLVYYAGLVTVTITGTNFTGASAVDFGGSAAASYTVNSATSITASTPLGTPGATVDVTVTNNGLTSATSSADQVTFTAHPVIYSVSPSSGTHNGGTTVTITGDDFSAVTSVMFGSTAAASYIVNSASSITAVSPAHAVGTVDITVSIAMPTDTSVITASDQFTFVTPLFLATPDSGDTDPAGPLAPSTPLAASALAPVVQEAEALWEAAANYDPAVAARLASVQVQVGPLAPGYLGGTVGTLITVSPDASGMGWFVDPTPAQNEEFAAVPGQPDELRALPSGAAANRVDLLSVVEHELGNVLQLPEHSTGTHDITMDSLPVGTRRLVDQNEGALAQALNPGSVRAVTQSTLAAAPFLTTQTAPNIGTTGISLTPVNGLPVISTAGAGTPRFPVFDGQQGALAFVLANLGTGVVSSASPVLANVPAPGSLLNIGQQTSPVTGPTTIGGTPEVAFLSSGTAVLDQLFAVWGEESEEGVPIF